MMTAAELRAWLAPAPDEENRGFTFILALLRDIYGCDEEVIAWLCEPRSQLGGITAIQVMARGRAAVVEELLVQHWNQQIAMLETAA